LSGLSLFRDGRESVEDRKHSVRPSTCTTPEWCQRILADELNMRRIAAKFVPHLLNNDQWDHRVQVCSELQKAVRHDPNFLSRVITGDESWLYNCDPETKQQSSQWKTPSSPWPNKVCQVRNNIHSTLIIFFYIRGTVPKEFVPPGQTLNGNIYCKVLRWLRGKYEAQMAWDVEEWTLVVAPWQSASTHLAHCEEFLTENTWTLFPTLPTHLTWLPAISTCSLKWNSGWKGCISYPLKRSKQNRTGTTR